MKFLLLAVVLVLATGVAIYGAAAGWHGFSLDRQVKPRDVATLAVTIFIAFFLQLYLGSKATDVRAEKDLIIEHIREALGQARKARDVVSNCRRDDVSPHEKAQVVPLMRRLANELENVQALVKASGVHSLILDCEPLTQSYFQFKRASTGGDFPTKKYTNLQISDQERAFRDLSSKLQGLIFRVNRLR